MRNHQQATKAREAALQERANSEGKTLQQVRKEEEPEFRRKHGRAMNEKTMISSTRPFVPCRHEGTCKDDPDCSCQENGVCSHLCKCSMDCPQRFPGCICAPGTCRNQHCACFRANWECNPNTCKNCNCETIDGTGDEVICGNFPLTRMVQKRLYVAPSRISGFGLFLMENVEKDDLIAEYVGERISDSEVERRGAIYDTFKCSYILSEFKGGNRNLSLKVPIQIFQIWNQEEPSTRSKLAICHALPTIIQSTRHFMQGQKLSMASIASGSMRSML